MAKKARKLNWATSINVWAKKLHDITTIETPRALQKYTLRC